MGLKERREREREALRHEILDAARELFVKEGYENVSMRRIADKIDYSPTTIYLYFKDKADLLYHICEETFAKLASRLEALSGTNNDPVEALMSGCQAYVEFGLQYPNHYKVTFMNHPQVHVGGGNYLREGSMGMMAYNNLRAGVEACIRQGYFRENDIDAVAQSLWAAGHGITSLLITKPDFPWVERRTLIKMMIQTFVNGLKA